MHIVFLTLSIAKNIIGSFILFLPFVYNQMGLVMGIASTTAVYFLSVYSFCPIAYMSDSSDMRGASDMSEASKAESYSDLFAGEGRWVTKLVDMTILLSSMLAMAGYIILISLQYLF